MLANKGENTVDPTSHRLSETATAQFGHAAKIAVRVSPNFTETISNAVPQCGQRSGCISLPVILKRLYVTY